MTDDEAEIRRLIQEWSQALEARDVARLTASYAPDVLLFDAIPPYRTRGIAAYRKLWEDCLPCFPASFTSEHRDLEVSVGGGLALVHGLHRIRPTEGDHPAGQTWLRVTVGLRKIEGRWKVVHEHVSVPFDPMTEKVAYIADPDAGSAS